MRVPGAIAPQQPLLSLRSALIAAGIAAANQLIVLDASDGESYPGSGQKWLDRSGNALSFFLGVDGTVEASDPVFVGNAGNLARVTRWGGFDEARYFTLDQANPARVNNIHKDNALFTLISIFNPAATRGGNAALCGDRGSGGTEVGFEFRITTTRQLFFQAVSGGSGVFSKTTDSGLSADAWHLGIVSINEAGGANGGFFYGDGNYMPAGGANTWDPAYTSPSTGNASQTLQIAAFGANLLALLTGDLLAAFAIIEGAAATKAQCDTLYRLLRPRFLF